ncbi:MAG: DUF3560 domain-containing protein [Spirochaetes bacterium]|nr:DUF3560 domain-containing protein [Spirochaetota bacterium]
MKEITEYLRSPPGHRMSGKERTMRESRENRAERLAERAAKVQREANASFNRGHEMASIIPLGQPILIGHYSERRDRSYRARIDTQYRRSAELSNYASDLERRSRAAATNDTIYADALDPVAEIDAKLAALRAKREAIKARPHQSYELSNLGANIRRYEARREQLAALKSSARTERQVGDITVIEDPELARIQLVFEGKPAPEIRDVLKQHGFRWAPSVGAWQRQLNNAGRYAARQVLEKLAQ